MKYSLKNNIDTEELLQRFLTYVKTYSTSSESEADKGISPSTPQQTVFARKIADEMKKENISGVQITEHSYVYGFLPATKGSEAAPSVCMLSHIDTTGEVCGENVNPLVVRNYDGHKITLKDNVELNPECDAALSQAGEEHDTIITADGTTLLGADDKAGIAAIITAATWLLKNPEIKHGKIEFLFSPDEETGHGMDNVPLNLISSKRCYTVDGGHIGELETECFNAFKSIIEFTGISAHTGNARAGHMVNAITMASSFILSLPRQEAPETTDGYEGFYAPLEITGNIEAARVRLILRDFTMDGMEKRKALVTQLANAAAASFGGTVKVTHTQQYLNMKENLDKHPTVAKNLIKAFKSCGIEPQIQPIRGGTDGSRLTEMGIPTPNMFTGGHNYHSRKEWASLTQMAAASDVILTLVKITAEE